MGPSRQRQHARAETLAQKSAFKSLVNHHRCIVPIDGFYEWAKATKQPYFISMADDEAFALAGLCAVDTFTVITTKANRLISEFHDRMPAILKPEDVKTWLSNEPFEKVKSLLQPFAPESMKTLAVSKLVNSVRK
jgi:putative SOS response-associated peptidase YedK